MYDKDKRRIIRLTKDPLETYRRLEIIAAFSGVSVEQAAANLLDEASAAVWAALSVCDDQFKVDCLCCRDDAQQAASASAPGASPPL